ncbi:MAG: DNA-binding LytR/AlgR family response regulator [Roseivirga sp.]
MKVLIIEDENSAAQDLCDILKEIDLNIEIVAVIESVDEAVAWLKNNHSPDLGFFDIKLADGDSFEIFEKTKVDFPIIFTSAYDEYAIKAFKVNSVDYLLKPINQKALQQALDKYKSIYSKKALDYDHLLTVIADLRQSKKKQYKKSLLVYVKDQILPVSLEHVAYFHSEYELVYCVTMDNKRYNVDETLEKIIFLVDPYDFFRANRQFIISRRSVKAASPYFQRKLKISITPSPKEDLIVSKTKVTQFKNWLEM